MAGQQEHHELIIIKRHDDEEHEHHSSAWKVAHADFMTAMMAFFLIMWLINVTDKDVRKAIANYFNPVNLADSISERKGLNDPEDVKDSGTSADGEQMSSLKNTTGEGTGPGDDLQQGPREKALFQDPYAVLAEIIANAPPNAPTSPDQAVGENGAPGTGSGDAHRDPFDPVYWQMTSSRQALTTAQGAKGIHAPQGTRPDAGAPRPDAAADATSPPPPPATGETASAPRAGSAPAAEPKANTKTDDRTGAKPDANGEAARKLEAEVKADVASALGAAAGPHVEVRKTGEGTIISLTDDIDFAMFPIGSAVPDARLVQVMARIAQTLATRPGEVIIRGHTDARPFRSPTYDNWQLSAARANIAHYMLVRGGLDEKRIRQIEGSADRSPKNAADPNAPENRRIEIVLKETAP
ncbi:MotB family protein [Starkeya koreensis]|uniref:MotB family protein n=1 Tax=Ancylobacter koreensis TaxID=266121 RepID=A0ABT0DKT8_9HYPH|nr:MotB family protein [Ancylobacter koreensis]MCK0207897.1 MotB family protein [Ancylobacter koreensis]